MGKEFYRLKQINPYTWLIGENLREDFTNTMVCVKGKKRAFLIDTGCGIGNIRDYAERLTGREITVLTTHVHLDHIGGHSLFTDIYASEHEIKEEQSLRKNTYEERVKFLRAASENRQRFEELKSVLVKQEEFSYKPLRDGMEFQLGNTVLRAVRVPGHTCDSYVYVDLQEQISFTGDAITPTPWIFMENGASVEEYREAVKGFQKRYGGLKALYSGHTMQNIGTDVINDTIICTGEILNGSNDREIECYGGRVFEHRYGKVTLLYRKDNIYKDREVR